MLDAPKVPQKLFSTVRWVKQSPAGQHPPRKVRKGFPESAVLTLLGLSELNSRH